MDRITKALGAGDQDVMNLRAAIDGLVFQNWSDADIIAGVIEMARDCRVELERVLASAKDN